MKYPEEHNDEHIFIGSSDDIAGNIGKLVSELLETTLYHNLNVEIPEIKQVTIEEPGLRRRLLVQKWRVLIHAY